MHWVRRLMAAALFAQPNPYRTVENFFKLPEGRTWGSTSTVAVDSKGHIWIAERCGANSCVGKTVVSIMVFDDTGKILKSISAAACWPFPTASGSIRTTTSGSPTARLAMPRLWAIKSSNSIRTEKC